LWYDPEIEVPLTTIHHRGSVGKPCGFAQSTGRFWPFVSAARYGDSMPDRRSLECELP
jgi:hypothetical protein